MDGVLRWRFAAALIPLLLAAAFTDASAAAGPPAIAMVTGQDAGWPDVRGWTRLGEQAQQIARWEYNPIEFSPYSTYQDGVRVAVGDVNGDGTAEIVLGGGPTPTAPSPPVSNGPDQRVVVYRLNGTLVGGFTAYPGLFQGGVRVALADVERNGQPDVITAPGPGTEPEIAIYSQQWLQSRDRGTRFGHFLAYESSFSGGVSVSAGYWSGNPEIVVAPGAGRTPEIRVYDAQGRRLSSFLAFEPSYTGGLSVAVGDLNGDARPEIVVGTLAPPARIRAFDVSGTPYGSLIGPFPPDGRGVRVGVADLHGTGRGEILAGETSGANPLLEVIDPATGTVISAAHPEPAATNGIRVGAGDLDQNGRDEMLVATGWGGDGNVQVLGEHLQRKRSFQVYTWPGGGMNVAAAARIGMPLRSSRDAPTLGRPHAAPASAQVGESRRRAVPRHSRPRFDRLRLPRDDRLG
jgi:hypothetical protein